MMTHIVNEKRKVILVISGSKKKCLEEDKKV